MQLQSGSFLQKEKYRIESVLGQGGFGITYLAVQKIMVKGSIGELETEIKVAIKEFFMKDVCNRDLHTSYVSVPSIGSKEMVERFKQKFIKEAKNISLLKHPNIVKVLDIFEENGTAYYVMEYVPAGSLQQYISENGSLQEIEALHYIRQVANALDYIHSQHMNHLDVKPGNILRRNNADAILIDFGLSKRYDEEGHQTSTTPVGISTGYAPMEQYKKGGVGTFSPCTDIYSLGATLYKLLTGETPPDASDVFDNGLPTLPNTISLNVRKAIQAAMEPKRSTRSQSIQEFLEILDEPQREKEKINEETVFTNSPREEENKKNAKKQKLIIKQKNGTVIRRMGLISITIVILLITIMWIIPSSSDSDPTEALTMALSAREQYIDKAKNCLAIAQLNLQKTNGKIDKIAADSYWQALQYFYSADSIDRIYAKKVDWVLAKLEPYDIPGIKNNLWQYYQSQNSELKELVRSGKSSHEKDIAANEFKIRKLNQLQFQLETETDDVSINIDNKLPQKNIEKKCRRNSATKSHTIVSITDNNN